MESIAFLTCGLGSMAVISVLTTVKPKRLISAPTVFCTSNATSSLRAKASSKVRAGMAERSASSM